MSFFRNLFQWRLRPKGARTAMPQAAPAAKSAQPDVATSFSPAPPASPASPEPAPSPSDCIAVPLKAVTDLLPPEIKPALRKQPSEHVQVHIPRALIAPQLAAGAVRITFAQLRAATPEVFFHPEGAPSDAKLLLPLDAVLRGMMPSRREDQQLPAIPVNIPSIFAKAGASQARPAIPAARASAEPWYSQRRPTFAQPQADGKTDAGKKPGDSKSDTGIAPKANGGGNGDSQTRTALPARVAPAPAPAHSIPPAPAAPAAPPPPAAPAAPAPPAPAAPATPAARMPATPADCVAIPFSMVLPALPPELRDTLSGSGPATGSFVIPLGEFEPRIRSGKLRFKWSQLSGWGGNQLSGSPAGDMEVDLPLAPVVPLFLAARQPPDTRKKVEVDSRIPDIFAKSNGAAPEPAPAASPTPAPIAAPAPAARPLRLEQTAPAAALPQAGPDQSGSVPAEPAKMAGKVAEANQDSPALRPPLSPSSSSETGVAHPPSTTAPSPLLGGPGEGEPGRIIQRIRALAGVAGAFLATADGFLIAGDAPEANASVLAAFAPTVFTQVGKYSGMARLGAPEAVDLHLGSASIHIRKAGKLFLGVLMPHGRPLPLFEIEQISTTLQPHAP